MRAMRPVLTAMIIVAIVATGGCRDGSKSSNAEKSGQSSSSTPSASGPASATSSAATTDPATKAACATMQTDIDTTITELTKAEKIGPPAGHFAVGARYSAGAAALYAHMTPANAAVQAAADKVAKAMTSLADMYQTPPATAPDKAALMNAIAGLKTACGTG